MNVFILDSLDSFRILLDSLDSLVNSRTPMGYVLAVTTLWRREIVRFLRQRNRIVGALGTPLVFWLLIGSGLGSSFRSSGGGERYLEYSFPGTLALILLFTSIFSTISIIEDRQAGFLQSVLVAPVRRSAITLGKILGGSSLALVQALIFLALAPTVGIGLTLGKVALLCGILFLIAFGLSSIGYFIAWKMDSTQGFPGSPRSAALCTSDRFKARQTCRRLASASP